jgi:glutamate/tyrosine decarboxylase-like PLP-dependent enzyme
MTLFGEHATPPDSAKSDLLSSYFLGPKAQNAGLWQEMLARVFDDYAHWRRNYFPEDESIISRMDQRDPKQLEWLDGLSSNLDRVLDGLKADYPFYSPRYVAHMTSDQTLPGVLGLFAGMLYNPNNLTREVAPVTVDLEIEVGELLATMLGFTKSPGGSDDGPWGHLTSGGTVATMEALWVARQAQFVPLVVAHCCEDEAARKEILDSLAARGFQPSKKARSVLESEVWSDFLDEKLGGPHHPISDRLKAGPSRQLPMLRELRCYLADRLDGVMPKADKMELERDFTAFVMEAVNLSPYNPAQQGYAAALANVNAVSNTELRRGVVFAPETVHYCLKKTCNVLGYGGAGLRLIPVDERFRMRVDRLEAELDGLGPDEYVAAVVTVAGTTEEGAVDPIDEVAALRDDPGRAGASFWLHTDAAWGGYVACVFDRNADGELIRAAPGEGLMVRSGSGIRYPVWPQPADCEPDETIEWGEDGGDQDSVKRAFGALERCDSAVVDPHKLGYIPYPSGAVVFRDGRTRLLTAQTASYIGAGGPGARDSLAPDPGADLKTVGEYVLEGSKPGASATAVWLAHKTIPLTQGGHGEIIGETLLAAQKLANLLDRPPLEVGGSCSESPEPSPDDHEQQEFTAGYLLVTKPDTNVLTFVVRPLRRVMIDGTEKLEEVHWSIAELNKLNSAIHARMGVPQRDEEVKTQLPDEAVPPYGHPFFVSRTKMRSPVQPDGTYSFKSLKPLLERLLPKEDNLKGLYNGTPDGLIAIRCVVMNPYYHLAETKGDDYIRQFVRTLDGVANGVLKRFAQQLYSYTLIKCRPGTAEEVAEAIKDGHRSIRQAVVVEGRSGTGAQVLLEVREPLGAGDEPRKELRQLGRDHVATGIEHAETFVETERRVEGEPVIDGPPIVYVFLKVEAGSTLEVLQDAMKAFVRGAGGMEGRIVTGRFDVAVSLSGMDKKTAELVIGEIEKIASVKKPIEVLWCA